MMLEEATWEAFGYYPGELKPKSSKLVIASCELCGDFRVQRKGVYHTFCQSCASKQIKFTEEWKRNIGIGHKGLKRSEEAKANMSTAKKGKAFTEEHKANISKNHADQSGENNSRYLGGKKVSWAKTSAKRKRDLDYTLVMSLADGEVGHHFTDEYVIGIPAEVHVSFGGGGREKHRAKVLEWLKVNDVKKYEIILNILEAIKKVEKRKKDK